MIKNHTEDDIEEIISNAINAVSTKRWVSANLAQPDTVELSVRIFEDHMQQSAMSPDQSTTKHKYFGQYITRECLASTESAVLHSTIPHLGALDDIAPGNMPALAKALCTLRSVDFVAVPEVETVELSFHVWLQEHMNLGQL